MAQQGFPTEIVNISDFSDFRLKLEKECINKGATEVVTNLIVPSSSITLTALVPETPTEAWYCNSLTIGATKGDCIVTLSNVTGPDLGSKASSQRYIIDSTGSSTFTASLNRIVTAALNFGVTRGDGTTPMDFTLALDMYRMTNDFNFSANKVILWIGDSITRGTNLSATGGILTGDGSNLLTTALSPEDHFTFQVRNYLQTQGVDCRLVNKAMGDMDSFTLEAWRKRGWLDIDQADIIFYQMGMNCAQNPAITDSVYINNLNKIIELRNRKFKNSPIVFVGDSPTNDDTRHNRLTQLRALKAAKANISDNIYYVTLEDIFDRKVLSNYNSNDGVHPNVASNILMSNKINTYLTNTSSLLNQLK